MTRPVKYSGPYPNTPACRIRRGLQHSGLSDMGNLQFSPILPVLALLISHLLTLHLLSASSPTSSSRQPHLLANLTFSPTSPFQLASHPRQPCPPANLVSSPTSPPRQPRLPANLVSPPTESPRQRLPTTPVSLQAPRLTNVF